MKIFNLLVSALILVTAAIASAKATPEKAWIAVSEKLEIYTEYYKPKKDQPTVVLLNGLTYSTKQWADFIEPLVAKGVGVLAFDFEAQGKVLLKYAPIVAPVSVETQVENLKTVLNELGLEAPYNIAGLSYGGGIAFAYAMEYPDDIQNLILIAPYTKPLEKLHSWINAQIWATRAIFPFNKYSDDELYDYFYKQIVYATYPQAEPIVLENPFKLEATFRLAQGIRKYVPEDLAGQLQVPTHLMIARKDQYIPVTDLENFWDVLPNDSKMSRIFVNNTEHKMPEAIPNFTAAWIYQIIRGRAPLFQGKDFEGYPLKGTASSADETIVLTGSK